MAITVTLDVNAKQPVTVNPNPFDVTSKGVSQITWAPATGQTFTFVSLSFGPNAMSFGPPNVSKTAISVSDTNPNTSPVTSYPYTIVVSLNGVNYSSEASGVMGTGGTPMIRNH
ncbi:MAG: hypothetical protein ABI843_15140 [Dokdonella sp.]